MCSIGHFCASDDKTIRIRTFFEEIRLLRPVRLQRPPRSMRLQRLLRPEKALLRSSKSSMFLNSIIWELISLYFDVLEKICLTESWKLMLNFSTFSVGGCWGQSLLLFWKLIDETQMPKPQEYADTFILT